RTDVQRPGARVRARRTAHRRRRGRESRSARPEGELPDHRRDVPIALGELVAPWCNGERKGARDDRCGPAGVQSVTVARLRLAPVRETMFPSRAPLFRDRLSPPAAAIAAWAEEKKRGNLPVSPVAPSPPHRPESGPW